MSFAFDHQMLMTSLPPGIGQPQAAELTAKQSSGAAPGLGRHL
jgi:hypothetical protein